MSMELCTVATSNNRQWWHCRSQWTRLMPSPIVMDPINKIIVRRQSAHKRSPSNATRKAVAISLEATRWPCWKMQQGHVRALWVSQQYSYRNNKYRCKDVNHRNACATNANCHVLPTSAGVKGCTLDAKTATILTISMADANNNNNKRKQQQQKTKPSWHVRHASRAWQLLDK